MRTARAILALVAVCAAVAQEAPPASAEPEWRRALMGLPDGPSASLSLRDIARLEENLRLAAPYYGTLTPGDYEANRELIRRVTAYLAAAEIVAHDPRMRLAIGRARRAALSLRLAIPVVVPPEYAQEEPPAAGPPAAPPEAVAPPFSQQAPELGNLPAREKDTAEELCSRYEFAAANAAAAWVSVDTFRQRLAARGMGLNSQTEASVSRLPLYLEQAATELTRHHWPEALVKLERAEYETEKVLKSVGR